MKWNLRPVAVVAVGLACAAAASPSAAQGQGSHPGAAARSSSGVTRQMLLSAPVPEMCGHPAGRLRNGSRDFGYGDNAKTPGTDQLAKVAYGELVARGGREAAAVIACNAGGVGWPDHVVVYARDRAGLKILGHVDLNDVTVNEHSTVKKVQIRNRTVFLTWDTYDGCCYDVQRVTARLRIRSGAAKLSHLVIGPPTNPRP